MPDWLTQRVLPAGSSGSYSLSHAGDAAAAAYLGLHPSNLNGAGEAVLNIASSLQPQVGTEDL